MRVYVRARSCARARRSEDGEDTAEVFEQELRGASASRPSTTGHPFPNTPKRTAASETVSPEFSRPLSQSLKKKFKINTIKMNMIVILVIEKSIL